MWQKAVEKHHRYQKTGNPEPASREGRRCPAPLASDRVLAVLLGSWTPALAPSLHPDSVSTLASRACTLQGLCLYNNRNQKPQQTMSSLPVGPRSHYRTGRKKAL